MEYIIFLTGALTGILIMLFFYKAREKDRTKTMRELLDLSRDSFSRVSIEALEKNSRFFLSIAEETLKNQSKMSEKELEGKKNLIDNNIEFMNKEISKMRDLVSSLEKDRENKFGELTGQLKKAALETSRLNEVAESLRSALADSRVRGQWGERMAEDVLQLAGLTEGINYFKQQTQEGSRTRPDYTFLLPQGLKVNMDVKFPLDNYLAFLESSSSMEKDMYKNKFLKDVRHHVKEVCGRDYINPANGTVDYVILFIPNEQVYSFINEQDRSFIDASLKQKVIVTSPYTLYAVLAVIRQAVDNFNLEKTAAKILSLMGSFNKQWEEFVKTLEKMGRRIDEAGKEYINLTSTRRNKLEKPLNEIEGLRREQNIEIAETPSLDSEET